MQQALSTDEALMTLELILRDGIEHGNWPLNKNCEDGLKAITALREALAEQAEQEPVGYWDGKFSKGGASALYEVPQESAFGYHYENYPLYAAPVRTKDLTDDDLEKTYDEICRNASSSERLLFRYARAVIAAYKEKNK